MPTDWRGAKAWFFIGLGFTRSDHATLCEALLDHGRKNTLVETIIIRDVVRYRVEGPLEAVSTTGMTIRTIWQDEEDRIRLVTAYPVGRIG